MRILYLVLITVMLTCASIFAQGQNAKSKKQAKKVEHLKNTAKPTSNSMIHIFVCRRCGSENQLEWGFPMINKQLELIPHCGYCGKLYWPDFKPTGLLERTYCRAGSDSGNYQAGMGGIVNRAISQYASAEVFSQD